ncbi:MAG: hypothetical protein HYU55_07350 [Nocardioides sp.]|nr:hypothetical protein [Nocardioides sp.]
MARENISPALGPPMVGSMAMSTSTGRSGLAWVPIWMPICGRPSVSRLARAQPAHRVHDVVGGRDRGVAHPQQHVAGLEGPVGRRTLRDAGDDRLGHVVAQLLQGDRGSGVLGAGHLLGALLPVLLDGLALVVDSVVGIDGILVAEPVPHQLEQAVAALRLRLGHVHRGHPELARVAVDRVPADLDDLLALLVGPQHVQGESRLVGDERQRLERSRHPQPDQQRHGEEPGQGALRHGASLSDET